MEHISGDRRTTKFRASFPLIDSEGNEIAHDRRNGLERRKSKRDTDVAVNILNIIN